MDTVKVTYIGASGRRRARGKTESYWFSRGSSLYIPTADVEPVTSRDPENWQVAWPKVQATDSPTAPQPRRGRRPTKQGEG